MANVSYDNPAGMMPQIGWKPQGFLAGDMYAQQNQDYQKEMGLSDVVKMLGIMKQQSEYQDYQANAPVRDAERGYNIQNFQDKTKLSPFETGAKIEQANANAIDAAPAQQQKQFERDSSKANYARELQGNYLSAILGSDLSPAEKMMAWKEKAIPELERNGVSVPEQYKNMDIRQMELVNNYITNNSKSRVAMMEQGQKETGLNKRNTDDNLTAVEVARIRADASHKDTMTAAQMKEDQRKALEDELKIRIANTLEQQSPGASKKPGFWEAVTNKARIESYQWAAGNPYARSDAAGQEKGVEAEIGNYRFNSMQADTFENAGAVKEAVQSKKIHAGDYFKLNGELYRWDGGKATLIPKPSGTGSPGFQTGR